jgi:ferredoxin
MRVRIDTARCKGNAMCWAAAPEVFGLDENTGYAYVPDEEVPPQHAAQARVGAGMCPEHAVEVIEE